MIPYSKYVFLIAFTQAAYPAIASGSRQVGTSNPTSNNSPPRRTGTSNQRQSETGATQASETVPYHVSNVPLHDTRTVRFADHSPPGSFLDNDNLLALEADFSQGIPTTSTPLRPSHRQPDTASRALTITLPSHALAAARISALTTTPADNITEAPGTGTRRRGKEKQQGHTASEEAPRRSTRRK
jgi:hypothetical protein